MPDHLPITRLTMPNFQTKNSLSLALALPLTLRYVTHAMSTIQY